MLLAARVRKQDLERPVDDDRERAVLVPRADDEVSRLEPQQLAVPEQPRPVVLAPVGQEDEVVPRSFRPRIGEVLGKAARGVLGMQVTEDSAGLRIPVLSRLLDA